MHFKQNIESAKNELISALGKEKVLTDDAVLTAQTQDLMLYYYQYSKPSAVVLPHSTEEVQKIVCVANKYKIPIVPMGGATTSWAPLDSQGGFIIDLSSMDKLIKIDTKNLTFTVQAGRNVRSINYELNKVGCRYPTYPFAFGAQTFGAEVAKETGGEIGSMYGHVSKRLIALEVVLGNGDVIVTGSTRAIKGLPLFQQSGMPDLTQLFVASEGAYGIITEVTMGMQMMPVGHQGVDIKFEGTLDGFRAAVDACHEVRMRKGLASEGHLVDWYTAWLLQRGPAGTGDVFNAAEGEEARKKYGQTLIIEIDSFVSEEECSLKKAAVLDICNKFGGEFNGDEGAKLFDIAGKGDLRPLKWVYGHGMLGVMFACEVPYEFLTPYYEKWLEMADQVGWPREKLNWITSMGDESCLVFCSPWRSYDQKDWLEKFKEIGWKTLEFSTAVGALPYRVGRVWRPHMLDKLDPRYLKYIKALKYQFDPNNIMNPGVSVFEEVCK